MQSFNSELFISRQQPLARRGPFGLGIRLDAQILGDILNEVLCGYLLDYLIGLFVEIYARAVVK
jgi:hypothetical protein